MAECIKLFITADDFGYCPARNAGIIECFKAGGITDTSLMVNAKYAAEAANLGLEHGLTMGLHFNISEGKPLMDFAEIASLTDDTGCFQGKMGTMLAAEHGLLQIEHIKRELSAQIERFNSLTGSYPRRIDGHQHVHILPTIREAFAQVLCQYSIKITRIPNDLSLDEADWIAPETKAFLKNVAKHSRDASGIFKEYGIGSSDAFIGCSLMNLNAKANLTVEHLEVVMNALPPHVTSIELMVHPGYPNQEADGGCGVGPDDFSKDIGRKWELEFIISDNSKESFANRNWQVQSWEA